MNRRILLWLFPWAIGGCSGEPVKWGEVRYSLAGSVVPDSINPPAPEPTERISLPDPSACRASIRVARAGKSFYAAWWSVRPDSSSSLDVSRSDDGAPWLKPVVADSNDASRRGCARPAPSIATDMISGYVHLGYFLEPVSGAGVFSVHTMDRGSSFHSPSAMVFGARPSNTSVAAEGDRVVVAYEDPNSVRPQIFVALSRTMGHIFELRLPVSEESGSGLNPVATLRGTKLEVRWTEMSPASSTRERPASRAGTWK